MIGDDTLRRAVAVVEWPDRAGAIHSSSRLDVAIAETGEPTLRALELTGHGAWAARLDRLGDVHRFLVRELGAEAWAQAHLSYLQGDASLRAYARIRLDGASRVLMNAPRMPDGPPIRRGLPYSRIAHLAEDVRPFVAMGRALERIGTAAPHIYAHDMQSRPPAARGSGRPHAWPGHRRGRLATRALGSRR